MNGYNEVTNTFDYYIFTESVFINYVKRYCSDYWKFNNWKVENQTIIYRSENIKLKFDLENNKITRLTDKKTMIGELCVSRFTNRYKLTDKTRFILKKFDFLLYNKLVLTNIFSKEVHERKKKVFRKVKLPIDIINNIIEFL